MTPSPKPYDWALRQLRIPQAHRITSGRKDVVVAVIDLGYRPHPDHRGHLWVNPDRGSPARHGWDCHDDDASLEDNYYQPPTDYSMGHHAFVVGQVIACAPDCRVMPIRVGYGNPHSWSRGIEWAVAHRANVLVVPHGYLPATSPGAPLAFERGLDFTYPADNVRIRDAFDAAWDAGCLIIRGAAENRGRRVAAAFAAIESVMAVGSSNRAGEAADICCDSDYVEAAAPGGERHSGDPRDAIWGTGGEKNYIPFTGGCMAAGFGAGVAALVWSRFPNLTNEQLRQVLRNTARGDGWNSKLGHGILDAAKACALKPEQLAQRLDIKRNSVTRPARNRIKFTVVNRGAFDVHQAMAVAYNGDPRKAPSRQPAMLVTTQLGHTSTPVRGFGEQSVEIRLAQESTCPGIHAQARPIPKPDEPVWVELFSLDRHGSTNLVTRRLSPARS